MAAEAAEVAGPVLGCLEARRVDDELVSGLVEGRRGEETCDVGTVADLSLSVAAQDV